MVKYVLIALAAYAIFMICKIFKPILKVLIFHLFQSQIEATGNALGIGATEEITPFEDFSSEAKEEMTPIIEALKDLGFTHFVDYRNTALEATGSESYSSIWRTEDQQTVACISSVKLSGRAYVLADLCSGACDVEHSKRETGIVIETTAENGERLFTYQSESPLPEMPVRFKTRTVHEDGTIERVVQVHNKRLEQWKKDLTGEFIVYDSTELFFAEQDKQREELERFDRAMKEELEE